MQNIYFVTPKLLRGKELVVAGAHAEVELCGLADPELRKWTSEALAKLVQYHARTLAGGHKELDALVAKASKLLDRVPRDGEGKFREKMRKDGSAIASAQAEIAEMLAHMKKAEPHIDEEDPASMDEANDPGSEPELSVIHKYYNVDPSLIAEAIDRT